MTMNLFSSSDDGTPSRLLLLSRLFKISKAVNLAGKVDLFTTLEAEPQGLTCNQIADRLGFLISPAFRGTNDFLDLLVAVGLLLRKGSGALALYHNSQESSKFLVKGSMHYIGGILTLNSERSYPLFNYLEHALRTGERPAVALQTVPDILTTFGSEGEVADFFAEGMTGASLANFQVFAASFDFTSYHTLADIGGSCGCLCACVADVHPHMTCTTLDLPSVHSTAARYIKERGLEARIQVADLDFFSNVPFPPSDVITMSMVLHDWGLPQKKALMRKAFDALPVGGALVAIDAVIDDDRRENVFGLAQSLNMLLEFGAENAFDYTFQEFAAWAVELGYSRTTRLALPAGCSAVIAYK